MNLFYCRLAHRIHDERIFPYNWRMLFEILVKLWSDCSGFAVQDALVLFSNEYFSVCGNATKFLDTWLTTSF